MPLSGTVYELRIIVMKIGIIYKPLLWRYETNDKTIIISRLKIFLDFNPIVRPWEILSMWGSELSSTNRFRLAYLQLSLINFRSSSRITSFITFNITIVNNLYVNCSSCPWNLSKTVTTANCSWICGGNFYNTIKNGEVGLVTSKTSNTV